jgi:hypothetical protein
VLSIRSLALVLVYIAMANFDVPVVGPLLASELFDKSYASVFAECTEAAYNELDGLLLGVFFVVGSQQIIDTTSFRPRRDCQVDSNLYRLRKHMSHELLRDHLPSSSLCFSAKASIFPSILA